MKKRFYEPRFSLSSRCIFWFTLFAVIIFDIIVGRFKVRGRENLLKVRRGGAFLVSNHTMYLDPAFIAHAIAPRRTCFTAMEETFRRKCIGPYIRSLGAFPVSQTMPANLLIDAVKGAFGRNWFVHFFPEGELDILDPSVREFKRGVFFLAVLLDKPVIPVAVITKPRRAFSDVLNIYLSRIEIVIGKPLFPRAFGKPGGSRKDRVTMMQHHARHLIEHEINRRRREMFN
ncbi:MAG: 1-acyl-sn-glycerol-3-phosphate acyltransferase [Spirochaetales bacterium]|nr:1-acyl-sn-glycerol-3-phosphate acyltransferase [Spirochaetales bacterium]